MVTATLRVVVPASKRKEVLQALRSLRGPTEAHAGCCAYRVYRDTAELDTWLDELGVLD